MKNSARVYTERSRSGFTLVELLVVVAIIAVLSVIGITIFTGVQKSARDARRREDLNNIANAMEANYSKTTLGEYDALAGTMFSSGTIPTDPLNTSVGTTDSACPTVCMYCVREGDEAQTGAACENATTPVAASAPGGGATNKYWTVCANLENGGFYCRGNQQ